jgi:adenine-specific DNA-methyltransferase
MEEGNLIDLSFSREYEHFDADRLVVGGATPRQHKSALGQFLTPYPIARFMASLFSQRKHDAARLLDPGTGLGALTGAFIERWKTQQLSIDSLSVATFEIDEAIRARLSETIEKCWRSEDLTFDPTGEDFIEEASLSLLGYRGRRPSFTHAILNPPYRKISSDSRYRHFLRKAGIETVNLYSGFLALTIRLMEPQGEVVAIVPRSFCNGPYYKPFRELLLEETAIRHIHLFTSRNSAFKDDAVLQENLILHLEKGGVQGEVKISTSTDDTFADHTTYLAPFDAVVQPEDCERFIHVATSAGPSEIELSSAISYSLQQLDIQVSTGPIVDFRVRENLRADMESGCVPLIYPAHFVDRQVVWPANHHKKPNALMVDRKTEKWLYPTGFYTVTRRFSSKEETRRIVAHTVSPNDFAALPLAFENHLNVFHNGKHGLDEDLARGLTAFLNSTAVDVHFRRFNGHTQVNATDLRNMKYPSRERLSELGRWFKRHEILSQGDIDREIRKIA